MNLYSNFEAYSIPCRIVVEFDERAAVDSKEFHHRLTAEVNGDTLIERLKVSHSELTQVVTEYRNRLMQIAKIISDPTSDQVIVWLRSNAFNFTDNTLPFQQNDIDDLKDIKF